MDGWMDGWTDGRIDGWTYAHTDIVYPRVRVRARVSYGRERVSMSINDHYEHFVFYMTITVLMAVKYILPYLFNYLIPHLPPLSPLPLLYLIPFASASRVPCSNLIDDYTGLPLANGKRTHTVDVGGRRVGFVGLIEDAWIDTLTTIDRDRVTYKGKIQMYTGPCRGFAGPYTGPSPGPPVPTTTP